jgi:hypothetical protein
VGTLEWTCATPPVHHNFDVVPTVNHGPHEFANPEVKKKLGQDWVAQDAPVLAELGNEARGPYQTAKG